MRTLLMQIMNIDLMIANGDTSEDAKTIYPLPFTCLRQILEDPTLLDGKRTEVSRTSFVMLIITLKMRYDPYRRIQADELNAIAHRRLIATIDTVDHLCTLMDLHNTEDKVSLVKSAYAPLALFCCVASTTKCTKERDKLCLCSYGYVPRGIDQSYELYHLANRLVDRTLDELVEPFRAFNFKDQEVALMKAIVTLNPHIRTLSTEAAEQVADLRDRIQETLYNVVRESHPKEVASSRFGNLLLFLPSVMMLGSVMYENLQFMQSFGKQHIDPLLSELLDNIEPMQGNSINVDDVLSDYASDHNSESGYLRHSQSASSVSSLASSSTSSFDTFYGRRLSIDHLIGQTSSQQPSLTSADSDPDYNVTLTAETFTGMRQAIASSMEVDEHVTGQISTSPNAYNIPNSAASARPTHNGSVPAQRPFFFIEPAIPSPKAAAPVSSATHTIGGNKHVFTVEPTRGSDLYAQSGGCANANPTVGSYQPPSQFFFQQSQPTQQPFFVSNGNCADVYNTTISKSQSYPYFLAQQQQQNGQVIHSNSYANHHQ
jgi:hypothetical protein